MHSEKKHNRKKSKGQGKAKYQEEQNTGQSQIQRRAKDRAEQNTKKSICDESAANGWRAAAPRPIIPFHPNHDADNRDEEEEEKDLS